MASIKISYLQTNPLFGEKQANFRQVEHHLKNKATDLIVLPELFASGYTFKSKSEVEALAEPKKGETSDFLFNIANQIEGLVVAGFPEKKGDKIYNSAMIVSRNQILGVYRKIHLFNKEKLWFSPGNQGFQVVETTIGKIGMMVCFDWIFPESARTLALKGAQIIAHPANLVLPYCQRAMVTRCLENHLFAITANRIGAEHRGEDKFEFTGQSQITGPIGNVLTTAPPNKMSFDSVSVNLTEADDKSLNSFNHLLKDRKPGLYF